MTAAASILLLADEPVGSRLAQRLAPLPVARYADPYEVLAALRIQPWATVLLTAPRPEFPGLCRAVRRLAAEARLYVLCPPLAEANVMRLAPGVVDDYFIWPPTRVDLGRLAVPGAAPAPADGNGHALTTQESAALLNAAATPTELEAAVSALISRRLGLVGHWTDGDPAAPGTVLVTGWSSRGPRVFRAAAAVPAAAGAFLGAVQAMVTPLTKLAARAEGLAQLAMTDHLTGAYNRRYFYQVTDQTLAQAARHGLRASLLLFDIDDFKRYNDTYGHAVGDSILRQIAALMKKITRSHDIVARIGGDEFAILFCDTAQPRESNSHPPESAYVLADRFRRAVESHAFPDLGPQAQGTLTISGGLAAFPAGGATCRELLSTADAALRQGKTSGKNIIRLIGQ
ncbi:MAG: GGDEF domain-containing protein [Planctomycetaceae bacterium]|nr:GGDEF domain-containing protein [Planctomycetaceae bacterium]